MTSYILTKWVEPYILLETAKKSFEMKDYTFDGFNKQEVKNTFLRDIKKSEAFGLYMKNVNKFYLFQSHHKINITEFLKNEIGITDSDFYITNDPKEPFMVIDSGKAEASFIM